MARDRLERLNQPEVVAVRLSGRDWPRPVLGQHPLPDGWIGLLQRPDHTRRVIPSGEDPLANRDDVMVLIRNRPITIPLECRDRPDAEHNVVSATVELLVRCPPRETELGAFAQEVQRDVAALTLDLLARTIAAAGGARALEDFVAARPAHELVHGDMRDPLLEHLRAALSRFLFGGGLVLEGLGHVEFRSRTLQEQEALRRDTARQMEEIECRARVEQAARAAMQRRLDDLRGILDKLQTAAAGETRLRWHELLPTLTPGERGRLLENLWRVTPNAQVARAIVAVTDRDCIWLDPADPERVMLRRSMPEELGGVRSVTYEPQADELLVGMARGLCRVQAGRGEVLGTYAVPESGSLQFGFNAAARAHGRLYGTHSQHGAWSWSQDDPRDVVPLLRPVSGVPRTIRAATAAEIGLVLVAADDRVHAFGRDGGERWQTGSTGAAIQCLAVLDDRLYAGTARGTLVRSDLALPGEWVPVHAGREPIETVQARRWDDLVELVVPAGEDGVVGIYASEGITATLLRSRLPIRRAWASDDALIGLTEARDRLVVLNGALPERTGREVPLGRLAGGLIQHVCLVTGTPEAAAGGRTRG